MSSEVKSAKVEAAYAEMGGIGNRHARLLRGVHEELEATRFLLRQIVEALPSRRDWLDPELERAAKAILSR